MEVGALGYDCPRFKSQSCSRTVRYSMHTVSLLEFGEKLGGLGGGLVRRNGDNFLTKITTFLPIPRRLGM